MRENGTTMPFQNNYPEGPSRVGDITSGDDGEVVIHGLPSGFGHTVAGPVKRAMLHSLGCVIVVSADLEGVPERLRGWVNRSLRMLRAESGDGQIIEGSFMGPGAFMASELFNGAGCGEFKDFVICEADEGESVSLRAELGVGRGTKQSAGSLGTEIVHINRGPASVVSTDVGTEISATGGTDDTVLIRTTMNGGCDARAAVRDGAAVVAKMLSEAFASLESAEDSATVDCDAQDDNSGEAI